MSLPVFFPAPVYVRQIRGRSRTIAQLCSAAGVECRAFGNWINRPVVIRAAGDTIRIAAEPGDWGAVEIRKMGLEEAHTGWQEKRLTQEQAAQILGVTDRSFMRVSGQSVP